MENSPSRHHIWHEHNRYRGNLDRQLRNHRGFVIPSNVLWHRELHANLIPPTKPNPTQIHALLKNLEQIDHTGKFDVVNYTIDAFLDFDQMSDRLHENALAIADNLQLQLDYLQHKATV